MILVFSDDNETAFEILGKGRQMASYPSGTRARMLFLLTGLTGFIPLMLSLMRIWSLGSSPASMNNTDLK